MQLLNRRWRRPTLQSAFKHFPDLAQRAEHPKSKPGPFGVIITKAPCCIIRSKGGKFSYQPSAKSNAVYFCGQCARAEGGLGKSLTITFVPCMLLLLLLKHVRAWAPASWLFGSTRKLSIERRSAVVLPVPPARQAPSYHRPRRSQEPTGRRSTNNESNQTRSRTAIGRTKLLRTHAIASSFG